jgi:hypothetical protein
MSTKDQTLSAELHGEALLTAKRPELQPLIDHLREAAEGRDDIRTECAGVIAGSWFSSTAQRGEDLIAAGLLMVAAPVDLDELDKWMRIGWERRRGGVKPLPGQRGLGLISQPSEGGSQPVRLLGVTGKIWDDQRRRELGRAIYEGAETAHEEVAREMDDLSPGSEVRGGIGNDVRDAIGRSIPEISRGQDHTQHA